MFPSLCLNERGETIMDIKEEPMTPHPCDDCTKILNNIKVKLPMILNFASLAPSSELATQLNCKLSFSSASQ